MCCKLYVSEIAHVANCMCCKLRVLKIACVANCVCWKLRVLQIACVANSMCCKLHVLQTNGVTSLLLEQLVAVKDKIPPWIVSDVLKCDFYTISLLKKALLRKVTSFGAPLETIRVLFILSVLEQSAAVWHSSLSEENVKNLERVQKSSIKIMLKEKYKGYKKV